MKRNCLAVLLLIVVAFSLFMAMNSAKAVEITPLEGIGWTPEMSWFAERAPLSGKCYEWFGKPQLGQYDVPVVVMFEVMCPADISQPHEFPK